MLICALILCSSCATRVQGNKEEIRGGETPTEAFGTSREMYPTLDYQPLVDNSGNITCWPRGEKPPAGSKPYSKQEKQASLADKNEIEAAGDLGIQTTDPSKWTGKQWTAITKQVTVNKLARMRPPKPSLEEKLVAEYQKKHPGASLEDAYAAVKALGRIPPNEPH